jgi:dipeptidyl aminopeptidase/acylaminoacyl peptidase
MRSQKVRCGTSNTCGQRIHFRSIFPSVAWAFIGILCVLSVSPAGAVPNPSAEDEIKPKRAVTVADAIRMTRLGDYGGRAQFSPDGKKFVIVVKKGNPEENTNEYSLLFWRTEKVFSSSLPKVLVTMSSSSNREAIGSVSWLSDSETITFLGENPGELQQVYTYNIHTRALRKITDHLSNIHSYSMTPDGREVAFSAVEPYRSMFDEKARRLGLVISTQDPVSLVREREGGEGYGYDLLFFQASMRAHESAVTLSETLPSGAVPRLSPNGRYIMVAACAVDIPRTWREYSDPVLNNLVEQTLDRGDCRGLQRYTLIDRETGASRPLINSPLSSSTVSEAIWSPDSRSVVVTNVYLPLEDTQGKVYEVRKSKSFTVEVDIPTAEVSTITGQDLYAVAWNPRGGISGHLIRQESNTFFGLGKIVCYRKNESGWEECRDADSLQSVESAVEVKVEQDMQTPPKVFATDEMTHRNKMLFDLNPQLSKLRLARLEEIQWTGTDGHPAKGGLYYPVDYVPGQKYPLVIQTHGWNRYQFWIDGPYSTAFAAQPLAGKGLMVLQAEMGVDDLDTSREGPQEAAAYEGAIDYLDGRGLIDRDRVGIIGFSRTCFHVKYALTHSKYKFAAASITDGVDAGYLQYILALPSQAEFSEEFEKINGGSPYGGNPSSWMERSPGFNVDKARSPLLITAVSADTILSEWEWFGALARLRKPVEMIMLHDGSHVLEKPLDRIVSQQGNVDWFCFWLKSEEDPDPAKAEQYARWRKLRKLQEENEKKVNAAPVN